MVGIYNFDHVASSRVSARGGSGGGPDPTHSAPQGGGGLSPPCWQEKIKYFLYFTVISVKIGHFKHQNLKTRFFFSWGGPQTPHPFWTPLSNISGGNPEFTTMLNHGQTMINHCVLWFTMVFNSLPWDWSDRGRQWYAMDLVYYGLIITWSNFDWGGVLAPTNHRRGSKTTDSSEHITNVTKPLWFLSSSW